MTPRFYIFASLALIVLLSGCLRGGISTEIVSTDMLNIKSIDVFPANQVQPGDTIVVRMEVENVGQEATYLLVDSDSNNTEGNKDKWNGDYLLMDHCSTLYNANSGTGNKDSDFRILSGGSCMASNDNIHLVKDSAGKDIKNGACYLKTSPGQSHTFQWTMKAPNDDAIAKMTNKCTFKFQVAYAASAITNAYVYFADPVEIAERIYTKKDMDLVGDNIASYGPVAVNFMPAMPQPIPAKTGETWTVYLNMMNAGEGIADVESLNIDSGSITKANVGLMASGCRMINDIDNDFELVTAMEEYQNYLVNVKGYAGAEVDSDLTSALFNFKSCDLTAFTKCTSQLKQTATDYYNQYCSTGRYENCGKKLSEIKSDLTKELDSAKSMLKIYSKQSSRVPCDLTIPDEVTILTPFKFVTNADYTYKIRQDIPITTKPIKEVA